MSSRGYRRVGLYWLCPKGTEENWCDLHFRFHQHFDETTRLWFGTDKMSINQVVRSNLKHSDEALKSFMNTGTYPSRPLEAGGIGRFTPKRKGPGRQGSECELIGPLRFQGVDYHNLVIVLYGSFVSANYQDAELHSKTLFPVIGYVTKPIPPFSLPGALKWKVESMRRGSRGDVNRLRG